MTERFENNVFALTDASNVFRPHCVGGICKGFWAGRSHDVHRSKSCVFNFFVSTLKCIAGAFKFLRFDERFHKAPFVWRFSMDGTVCLNVEIKLRFLNFIGVVWRGLNPAFQISGNFPTWKKFLQGLMTTVHPCFENFWLKCKSL